MLKGLKSEKAKGRKLGGETHDWPHKEKKAAYLELPFCCMSRASKPISDRN